MEKILRFWWGNNLFDMSENRHRCYRSIIKNSGIKKIEMITPQNYKNYQVLEHPIHEGFNYLSAVHKSDYLRAYVTYHYGGCWTDVKYIDHDWNKYFDILEKNTDKIGIGCREMIVRNEEYTFHDKNYIHYPCIGMTHFIFKQKTEVFKNYITNIDNRLTEILDELKKYPGDVHPMVCKDNHIHHTSFPDHLRNYNYPLHWMEISGYFFNAQLPYIDKIMYGMPISHNFMTGYNHR
jgi:hypothetical protein